MDTFRAGVAALSVLVLAWGGPAHGNGCGENPEPIGIGLEELRAKYATELAETRSAALLESAERFAKPEDDESRVLALLLLHRVLEGSFAETARADALILASRLRDRLAIRHLGPFYRCKELRALDEYVRAHGEGYFFAELWGITIYRPQEFLTLHLGRLSKPEAVRVRFEVYRSVDPCDAFQFDNRCYGPFFAELAEEAAGTPVHGEVVRYAFEINLDLAACSHASEEERALGEAAARSLAEQLGEKARRALADLEQGRLEPKLDSEGCRLHHDT